MFLITELDLFDGSVITVIDELLQCGAMTHIFNEDEKNAVINSIRTSGDQENAALSLTQAWDVFMGYDVIHKLFEHH